MKENQNIITLDFSSQNIPLPTESRNTSDTTYVNHGLNNQYPSFLLSLYNDSAVHSSIINQKVSYIIGNGLQAGDKDLDIQMNASDSLKEFTSKIIKDYLLFNSFAVEVVMNVFGQPVEYHHVPVHKIRMNKSKTKFWFCDDWFMSRKTIIYDRYSPKLKADGTSRIFYFDGYFPSINNTYPSPEYNGTLKSIVTDIAIKEFNLNNIKNHFSPSTIITFFNGGNVSEQVKAKVIDEFETKFRGESGKKFIIDFQTKGGEAAQINQLSSNDWDKAYLQIAENNINDIMIGHQVQNPSLFGIKTAGQLGSSQELEVSYEMLKNNYISVKREEIESALNQLFTGFASIQGRLKFQDRPLFNTQLKDEVKVRIYTINELRDLAGMPPLADGDRLLDAPTPTATAPVQQEEQPEEKKNSRRLTEEDYDSISHLGQSAEDFDVVEELNHQSHQFGIQDDVATYILEHDIKGLTLPELVSVLKTEGGLKVSENKLQSILDTMTNAGLVNIDIDSDGRLKVTPSNKSDVPDTGNLTVMYKYIKRPEVDGQDLIENSRGFCVKLINNNRLYTREDIQSMSAIFEYDVYTHTGGWYHNPVTETTTNYCRHMWQPMKVKRKTT